MFIDLETFSECNLGDHGATVYAEHPSTEIMMGAYAFDNGDVLQWDKYALSVGDVMTPEEIPEEVLRVLRDEDKDTLIVAWNMSFEFVIFKYHLGIVLPISRIMDPMINAFYLSFPGKLGTVGGLVGLPEDKQKDKDGKALIRTFSVPAKPTKRMPDRTRIWPKDQPEKYEKYKRYNRQDVSAMRDICYRLMQYAMPIHEWESWRRDFALNDRGIPVNKSMAENACRIYDSYREEQTNRLANITRLNNPNSVSQLLEWLQESGEYPFDNLKKSSVARVLREEHLIPEDPKVKEALELRRELAKTSATKFRKFRDTTSADGTIKFALQFGGAQRTLRWSGRLVQPHNLKKPSDELAEVMPLLADIIEHCDATTLELIFGDPMTVLSEGIRGCIQAPPGYLFADADLSAIENVVLGWAAREEKILNVFREGKDPYLSFAQFMYNETYEDLWHDFKVNKNKKKRTISKPAVLGCGYRLGPGQRYIDDQSGEEEATGLIGYAKAMYIDLTDKEAEDSVRIWRATYNEVVNFWYQLEAAAMDTLRTGLPNEVNGFVFDIKFPFMRIRLPSGRHLHYYKAHVRKVKAPWGEMVDNVCYWGLKEQAWCMQSTHGGKITENIVQAAARDILDHGLALAQKEGIDVRLHVHDQDVALVKESRAEHDLKILQECMAVRPSWAPDIPLNTGATLVSHFTKD
jgi:DNA polymerase